jgi:hypothetical protein
MPDHDERGKPFLSITLTEFQKGFILIMLSLWDPEILCGSFADFDK